MFLVILNESYCYVIGNTYMYVSDLTMFAQVLISPVHPENRIEKADFGMGHTTDATSDHGHTPSRCGNQ